MRSVAVRRAFVLHDDDGELGRMRRKRVAQHVEHAVEGLPCGKLAVVYLQRALRLVVVLMVLAILRVRVFRGLRGEHVGAQVEGAHANRPLRADVQLLCAGDVVARQGVLRNEAVACAGVVGSGDGETAHAAVVVDAREPVGCVCGGDGCQGEQQREEEFHVVMVLW